MKQIEIMRARSATRSIFNIVSCSDFVYYSDTKFPKDAGKIL
ncbi:3392_t:CDS:2 [Dentiscutata erythropus]|uniref:3392_t:CDS:1 n=1 Tax=Dentiscutata erythropus TaxID=1348616 RepID=A0A9N9BLR4_9GLOM|nr:3392_t:CDS:2 [Dentiscutata erythropus]